VEARFTKSTTRGTRIPSNVRGNGRRAGMGGHLVDWHRPGLSLLSLCVRVDAAPGRSNHKGLVSRRRTLPSENCPAKSTKLPGGPALLAHQCFCTFLSSLCTSQLVHVVKRKPVLCPCWLGAVLLRASADAPGSRSSISPVATHAPRAMDATKAALDPALFPFLHLLAANHWILVLLEVAVCNYCT
jgi:hypothetical protein